LRAVPAESPIAAVVLAAGASHRFGESNKLLATIDGCPLVTRAINTLVAGGIADIVVVTGHDRAAIEDAVRERPIHLVHNPEWEDGMGTSIAAGIGATNAWAAGAFIVPGDMPMMTVQLLAALIDAFARADRDRIVYPANSAGEQRNPVLWPRRYFPELCKLPPAVGAKELLQEHRADCVPVVFDCDAALRDVDTLDDLERARSEFPG
jgi:molybdenum cofactor cytidylyltransferase